jgi:hypothetical protein
LTREGTAFVVSGRLTTRTLAKLGEVAKIASVHANKVYTNSVARAIQEGQRRAIQALKKSVAPHSIATTAEGIQIRAAQAAETCALSEAKEVVSTMKNAQLGNSIEVKTAQNIEAATSMAISTINEII